VAWTKPPRPDELFVPQQISDTLFQGVPLGHERSNQFTAKIDHQLTGTAPDGYYYLTDHYLASLRAIPGGGANFQGRRSDRRSAYSKSISAHVDVLRDSGERSTFTLFREAREHFSSAAYKPRARFLQNSPTANVRGPD